MEWEEGGKHGILTHIVSPHQARFSLTRSWLAILDLFSLLFSDMPCFSDGYALFLGWDGHEKYDGMDYSMV